MTFAGRWTFFTSQQVCVSAAGRPSDEDLVDKSLHEWLVFGVRGAFDARL